MNSCAHPKSARKQRKRFLKENKRRNQHPVYIPLKIPSCSAGKRGCDGSNVVRGFGSWSVAAIGWLQEKVAAQEFCGSRYPNFVAESRGKFKWRQRGKLFTAQDPRAQQHDQGRAVLLIGQSQWAFAAVLSCCALTC